MGLTRLYLRNTKKNAATSTANQTNVRTMYIALRHIPQHTPGQHDCYCPLGVVVPHFISHHQSAIPTAVVTVDIPSAVANTFANSQYDTNAIS